MILEREKTMDELPICIVLLGDVYADAKTKTSDAECHSPVDISSAPVTKLAGNVLLDSEKALRQHREHKLEASDQL